MFRYCALLWNPATTGSEATVACIRESIVRSGGSFACAFKAAGLEVYCSGVTDRLAAIHRLSDDGGVVVGTLFARTNSVGFDSVGDIDSGASRSVRKTNGRSLLELYWGRYVAFIYNSQGDRALVIHSPTGELDCLFTQLDGAQLYFSTLDGMPFLHLLDLTVDWQYVAADLCCRLPKVSTTGLRQIKRLVHGECQTFGEAGSAPTLYWNPYRITLDQVTDTEVAAHTLRESVVSSVRSWSSCFDRVSLALSGGFDSSLLASLLSVNSPRVRTDCVNYFGASERSTDERQFAHIAAERTGFSLRTREIRWDLDLRGQLACPRAVSPGNSILALHPQIAVDPGLAADVQARFSGRGGDQLFYQNSAAFAASDYLRAGPLNCEKLLFALNAARIEGCTIWKIMFGCGRDAPSRRLVRSFGLKSAIDEGVVRSVIDTAIYIHPWMREMHRSRPGKWWHVYLLCGALDEDLYGPFSGEGSPQNVTPLISQPAVEACLRIPTYMLMESGRDRGLARRVFRDLLPVAIASRISKGTTGDSGKALVSRNLQYIRELLLDGFLVRERILDRRRLEGTLGLSTSAQIEHPSAVMSYVCAELWAASWNNWHSVPKIA